ncbi:MAG: hypothetical protein ACOYOH_19460 [Paracraurococcus sp.]
MWARLVLAASGTITAVFVARDAPNFDVVEGMVGIALIAAVVVAMVLLSWRRKG